MAQERSVIVEYNVSELLSELVSQEVSHLTDVQGRAKKAGDAVIHVVKSASKRISAVIGRMMSAYENGGIGGVGSSAAAW